MNRHTVLHVMTLCALNAAGVCAADPIINSASDKDAALKAANAWVALLDKSDFIAAGAGVSEESLAGVPNATLDQKTHTMGAVLASIGPNSRMGGQQKVTRKLEADKVEQVTSCGGCGIRDGEYFVFTYDLTNTWTNHHMFQSLQGTQVLYMLKEQDGTWKPAKIAYNQTSEKHGGAK